ncbi:MAG: polysaccharide biosynthesis/export family protein [Acidobacteriota bacterium]
MAAPRLVLALVGPAALLVCLAPATAAGQNATARGPGQSAPPASAAASNSVETPPDYLIGPDDVLTIVFWREKDMTTEVSVRPDGRITLPLLNEIKAAGLTPEQLRKNINDAAERYFTEPTVAVVVKQINSRKVFITGQVAKPGVYPLTSPISVLQLLTIAGGVLEYADEKHITVLRTENGRPMSYRFNYDEVKKRRNLRQNIELKPGDTVVVP